MERYDRGELAVCKASFVAADGSSTQPGSVSLKCVYTNTSNQSTTSTTALAYNPTTKVWEGGFDTTLCKGGTYVDWLIQGAAPLQGAEQGQFYVVANRANT